MRYIKMKNLEFATLVAYRSINNSNLGNPNYEVTLDRGDGDLIYLKSSSNCAWCYGIDRAWLNKTVSYHTTRSDRVDFMKLTDITDTFVDKILMGNK